MGMYTGVRCKVIIKPEFREELEYLSKNKWDWEISNINFMKDYGKDTRASFIPCGVLCYTPDCWEESPKNEEEDFWGGKATDGFDLQFIKETGYWSFQCSLKNYEHTIQTFFENVLSKIVEKIVHLETYYEELDSGELYELKDDKIIKSTKEGPKYRDYFSGWSR